MKEYKSQSKRLVILFRKSRDNWKETALLRYKKLRTLEIKIRDLTASRENWKQRASDSRKRTTPPPQGHYGREKKGEQFSEPIEGTVAVGHHYYVETVQLAVQQVIISGNSLRGVEKNLGWALRMKRLLFQVLVA